MTKTMEKFVEAVYCVIDVMDTLRNILSDFFRTPSKYWMRKNKKIVKTRRRSTVYVVRETECIPGALLILIFCRPTGRLLFCREVSRWRGTF